MLCVLRRHRSNELLVLDDVARDVRLTCVHTERVEKARNMASSQKRRKVSGKTCDIMFCNKTNADKVSMHQFPKEDGIRQKWNKFVLQDIHSQPSFIN